jgi:hypothetical protein
MGASDPPRRDPKTNGMGRVQAALERLQRLTCVVLGGWVGGWVVLGFELT